MSAMTIDTCTTSSFNSTMAPVTAETHSHCEDHPDQTLHGQPMALSLSLTSTETSSTLDNPPLDSTAPQKKKKKKKNKRAATKDEPATSFRQPQTDNTTEERPSVLCISRNKHWKYISSYHVSPHTICCSKLTSWWYAPGSMAATPARIAGVPPSTEFRPCNHVCA